MDTLPVDRAEVGDTDAILALLRANALPVDGLLQHLRTTIVARQNGRVVGCAGLEVYADGALLRSVAVTPALHGRGLGHALTGEALRIAKDLGVPVVYLLTTTAERFFPKFGFEPVDRLDVPESVRASIEFTSACPASAIAMRRAL